MSGRWVVLAIKTVASPAGRKGSTVVYTLVQTRRLKSDKTIH